MILVLYIINIYQMFVLLYNYHLYNKDKNIRLYSYKNIIKRNNIIKKEIEKVNDEKNKNFSQRSKNNVEMYSLEKKVI
jgi:hypothetical protein